MKHIFKSLLLCIFFFSITVLYAEDFRVGTVYTYHLDQEQFSPVSFSIRYNDAIAVTVKDDLIFLDGIELQIKQNQPVLTVSNMLAYEVYSRIIPSPEEKIIDYSGKQLISNLLPARSTHTINIPLRKNHSLKQTAYSDLLPYDTHITTAPFFFRLHPVMKGVPDFLETTDFKITIRPILRNEGGLQLNLAYPEDVKKPINVQIDNHYLTDFSHLQIVAPGTYRITVSSDDYRSEVRSCIIEKGKITNLPIQLKSLIPLLHLQVPSKVTVLLDNEKVEVTNTAIPISTGRHIITAQLGEYEAVREFTAEEGKAYHFTMNIDTVLKELE